MNIGIIVHSKSGHTFNVARKIASLCTSEKIDSEIVQLKAEGNIAPRAKNVKISNPPVIDKYDALIFAGPVWAFAASPVIASFLKSVTGCKGKKILCFVTMGFPFPLLGGNGALSAMNKILSGSGGTIVPGEVITSVTLSNQAKLKCIVERIVQKIK
jgi:NAD(P)H dehydrogenase (quinone)